MIITEHIKGRSKFVFYREKNLHYRTDTGLDFIVPLEETDGASFEAEDKSLFFMRWIRRRLEQEEFYHKYDRARDKL